MAQEIYTIELDGMTDAQMLALARFVKRIHFAEIREQAVDDDEAYVMRDAIAKLQKGLDRARFAPSGEGVSEQRTTLRGGNPHP